VEEYYKVHTHVCIITRILEIRAHCCISKFFHTCRRVVEICGIIGRVGIIL